MKARTLCIALLAGSAPALVAAVSFAQSAPSAAAPQPAYVAAPTPAAPANPPAEAAPPAPPAAAVAPAPATEPPPPKIVLAEQAPPPPPPVARTDKVHDGFYVRLNIGFGSQSTSIDTGPSIANFKATDGTLAADLLIGGAPSPGVILGGTLLLDSLPSRDFRSDNVLAKTGVTMLTLGPFIDGYPDPRGGFHLGGMVGVASAHLSNRQDFGFANAGGLGLAAWLGYDLWVAEQWSVGGLLRFSGARTSTEQNSVNMGINSESVVLMLSAVYQ
jgi:hypothetical protein